MKLKLFLPTALVFGLVNASIPSVTPEAVPLSLKTKTVPIEAYWEAWGWDREGSNFWTAKEASIQESA